MVTPGDKGAFVAIIELLCYQSIGSLDKEEEGAQGKQRRDARSMMHNPRARNKSSSPTRLIATQYSSCSATKLWLRFSYSLSMLTKKGLNEK